MTLLRPIDPPPLGDDWFALGDEPLPVAAATAWVSRPDCGAIVTFLGTARDHSVDRSGVDRLEYEAYESQVVPRLERVASQARVRWESVRRIAMLHRVGVLGVGDAAVVVAVSSPHRNDAFEAARFCIDTLKATAPIWKKERWADGESWGLEPQYVSEPEASV